MDSYKNLWIFYYIFYYFSRGAIIEQLNLQLFLVFTADNVYPNAFIREFIGLLWEKKLRHILFIVLLTLGLGALYYVAYID